ncbi:dynamin family protein [Catenuloplanes sp. NPDC051500]|uniref:dynamin family protein n=1 Tax=Catenuloplanes sp. NPDC051500 TaxID=3363959 RepID=UPI0037AC435F
MTTAPATPASKSGGAEAVQALARQLNATADGALAYLRSVEPDAAADLDVLARRESDKPAIVIVGETKRGKSSLVNALIGAPGLSPVDVAVSTSAYLEMTDAPTPQARAWQPGHENPVEIGIDGLINWGTAGGRLPEGARPPRRIQIGYPSPLLQHLTLIDTPGTGGLDPNHAEVALAAAEQATALLFVVDASSPLSKPELDFLIQASKRVNLVMFALTKTDAYPGWRTILADDKAHLKTHAPRFGAAPWFPVSARLAETAAQMPPEVAAELAKEARIDELSKALRQVAGRRGLLDRANLLRAIRSEMVRRDLALGEQMTATDPDPADAAKAKEQRQQLAARKRTDSRQWSLALNTHVQRARVESTGGLRTALSELQEDYLGKMDKYKRNELEALPQSIDTALHAVSVKLSAELQRRFRQVGEEVLSHAFPPRELQHVLGRLNAQLGHALNTKPQRDAGTDNVMVALSAGGIAMMAGRGAMAGASALGAGAVIGGGLLLPVVGVGIGLAAGAFILYKRRVAGDRQQAKVWLREVIGESRAALTDEVAHRFTDLQYALTLALDDAIERRLKELDEHIGKIDQALATDKATRAKKKAALTTERDALRARVKQVDEVLAKTRGLAPSSGSAAVKPGAKPAPTPGGTA